MKDIEKILSLLPHHLQKENNLKFYECLKPVFNYLLELLEEQEGINSIAKAKGEYLDYIGNKMLIYRHGLTDNEFRTFLLTNRFKIKHVPTTTNLLQLSLAMTGFYPTDIIFRPGEEPASQYIKFIVPWGTDPSKFPNLNEICDAGARIYQDILNIANRKRYSSSFISGQQQLKMNIEKFEIPARGV